MKKTLIILFAFFILGCDKKEIKLPTIGEKGLQELHNHSQVWMFFEIKGTDTILNLNKKNTISTTHWVFNVDKRLSLKRIIPSIITLQDKHANSIHAKEGMHNYFSYSDTISQQLSFLEFDNILFKTDSLESKQYIKSNSGSYLNYYNINLRFSPSKIWINETIIDKNEFKSTLLEFIQFTSEGKQTMLHLNFNQNLIYQDYLFYKTMISNLKSPTILVNNLEFIFDQNKVPNCGCD
jgi:hypothetical protein